MIRPSRIRKSSNFQFLTFYIVLVIAVALVENKSCQSFSFDRSAIGRPIKRRQGVGRGIDSRRYKIFNSSTDILSGDINGNIDDQINRNDKNQHKMSSVSQKTRDSLEGQSVLLTGATGGLGAQLAFQIASYCKPKNLILSGRKEDALKKIAEECRSGLAAASTDSTGEDADSVVHIVTADLSDKDSVCALGESAVKLCDGAVDVLINCGGVSSRSDFVDTKLEIDERVMQINFFSGASLAKAVVPGMISSRRGGKIVWISSVQGLLGTPSRTSYAASKFAVQGYCEAMRAELATSEVSVHCVSPGYIRTNLSMSAVTGDGTAHGSMDETTANGADPRDIAVEILDSAVAKGKADFVVAATASAKVAIWLRLLLPGFLQNMLVKRFEKAKKKKGIASQQHAVTATDKKID